MVAVKVVFILFTLISLDLRLVDYLAVSQKEFELIEFEPYGLKL